MLTYRHNGENNSSFLTFIQGGASPLTTKKQEVNMSKTYKEHLEEAHNATRIALLYDIESFILSHYDDDNAIDIVLKHINELVKKYR